MSATSTFLSAAAFVVLGAMAGASPAAAQDGRAGSLPPPRTVLVLSSERGDLPAVLNFQRGLRESLSEGGGSFEFFFENLDTARFPKRTHEAAFIRYMRERYSERRVDVVVLFLDEALRFLLAHRDEMFPGVPAIAATAERRHVETPALPAGFTRIPIIFDFDRTLDLALALQPGAREVLVVHGVAPGDVRRGEEASLSVGRRAPRLRHRMLGGVSLAEIEAAVASLPPQSFVLIASVIRDADGRPAPGPYYAGRLATVSPVPVYALFRSNLERGAIGGAITDFETVGRAAGATAAQVLSARPAPGAIVAQKPQTPMQVNWAAIEKWRIPPQHIPGEAQVLFRKPGLWDEYRRTVLATVALVLLQAALITGLLVQLSRRRRAEAARMQADATLRRKQNELEHMARVSTMGEIAASLAHELNQPLAAILSNAQAGLRLLERPETDPAKIREILDEVVADDKRAGNVIGTLRTMLRRGQTEPRPIELAGTVRDVLVLLHSELVGQHVEVETVLAPDTVVLADKTQVEQVLLNLMMNGIDAMRQRPARDRRLRVEVTRNSESRAQIAIRDSGMGIQADDHGRVFEAFWTTKPLGMGMGLAICRSIVDSYGGRIWMEPNADQGMTFFLTLPLASQTGTD